MRTARRLWHAHGEALYGLLDNGCVDTLAKTLTTKTATALVAAWREQGDSQTLIWLQEHGFDAELGRKLLKHFGAETARKIEEDPYRLLSFCGSWKEVDELARSHFKVAPDDPRRLKGAIEEALYRIFNEGHTCATMGMVLDQLESVLNTDRWLDWAGLVVRTLELGQTNGSYTVAADGTIHPVGPLVMERTVAEAIVGRLKHDPPLAPLLPEPRIQAILTGHEQAEFALTGEQQQAIRTAASNAFAVITGGAGVGKTTMLKALYRVYDAAGVQIHQVALAGRAAKRMQEATGRPAMTIDAFLLNVPAQDLAPPSALVVDESSMVDIWSLYKLCRHIPPHCRIVMVGDPAQLPPVGPGLTLHAIIRVGGIPIVELTQVRRHGGGIAQAAHSVRNGHWPVLLNDPAADIAFVPLPAGDPDAFIRHIIALYAEAPERTQILTATRRGRLGADAINRACSAVFAGGANKVIAWADDMQGLCDTGLRLGQPVICTRNLYAHDLRNGSLGRIVGVEPPPESAWRDANQPIARIEWDDGEVRPLLGSMLDDIDLAYAITTHKSQGSQWPRIIIPVASSRNLDRTLLYTALTRAEAQVILAGDTAVAKAAVESLPRADQRHVALDSILSACLNSEGAGE